MILTSWPQLFSREGAMWAIPALFPLLDLDDLTLISTDVVAQGLMPPLLKASQCYGDELLIVRGRLSQQGEQWQLQWHLHVGGAGKGEALINGQSQGTAEAVVSQTLVPSATIWRSVMARYYPYQQWLRRSAVLRRVALRW